MDTDDWIAVDVTGPIGQSPIVLVCEHASAFIPEEFGGLGLTRDAASSHAAWDIGALDVAKFLSSGLGAPLVAGRVSRLVYDCNRPLESAGAIPAKSEIYDVPGNVGLSDEERQRRYDLIHQPFHAAVANILFAQEQAMARPPIPGRVRRTCADPRAVIWRLSHRPRGGARLLCHAGAGAHHGAQSWVQGGSKAF